MHEPEAAERDSRAARLCNIVSGLLISRRPDVPAEPTAVARFLTVAVMSQRETAAVSKRGPSKEAVAAARSFGRSGTGSSTNPCAFRRAGTQAFYKNKHSLGCSYSLTTCILISGSILFNHLIFGYSQLAGANMVEGGHDAAMNSKYWDPDAGLFKAVFYADILFNTTSDDARKLRDYAYGNLCLHTPFYPEIDCERSGGVEESLCEVLKCQHWQMSKQAVQMSYMYSIWDLWVMETVEPLPGMPADSIGEGNVTKHYGQAAAGVLFGFSFIWPHLKLALLHLFFYLPMASRARRNGNYWLAVFGKWSFTDVLVLSTLVGVFHLTVDTTAHDVWSKAAPDLVQTCQDTCFEWIKKETSGPDMVLAGGTAGRRNATTRLPAYPSSGPHEACVSGLRHGTLWRKTRAQKQPRGGRVGPETSKAETA